MITKIWLHEYGPFREAELRLAPLTVLVGPNASGKTIAMEALRRVQEVLAEIVKPIQCSERRQSFFRTWGRIGATGRSAVNFEANSSILSFKSLDESTIAHAFSRRLVDALPPIRLLKFDPDVMRSASYLDAEELSIQRNGYGLATVLADMKLQDDDRLGWIEKQVESIIPSFERVKIRRAQVSRSNEPPIAGQELIFDMKNAHGLSPAAVSDGTILVLGIVTSIASTTRSPTKDKPTLVLIDDLERGLHPRALSDFITCLRRMTEEMSVQILATSHSPYLLDWLKPEEVRLTGFLEDGSSTICELSEHPEFERWKDVMTPGEFWSTAAEDWIRDVHK